MPAESFDDHLSRIATKWTLVCRAHEDEEGAAEAAQREMLDRYGGAVRRYLQGVLRDSDAADELFQEFAIRFLRGKLKGANPERGRFRDFVKGVLFHLITDHRKKQYRSPRALPAEHADLEINPPTTADADREFLTSWRDDLLARTWQSLQRQDEERGQAYFPTLRCRADHPDWSSQQLAEELSTSTGKPLTPAGVRQTLHRARESFADLLLDEVIQSLENPNGDQVHQELVNLKLLEYCRPGLERRGWLEA